MIIKYNMHHLVTKTICFKLTTFNLALGSNPIRVIDLCSDDWVALYCQDTTPLQLKISLKLK